MGRQNMDLTRYLVTDRRWLGERSLWDSVDEAIQGGGTLVQLREKEISSKDYLELAQRVRKITDRHHVPLIINDRIDIALAIDGIKAENARPVMETGVDGVAVVSAIMDQTDIREAARQLLSLLEGAMA